MSYHSLPWEGYLRPDETLIWSGRPDESSVVQYLLTLACVFLVVSGGLLAWGSDAIKGNHKLLYLTGAGAALYVPLLLLFVAGVHRIDYAITDKRILILRSLGLRWLRSYRISFETEMRRGSVFQGVWFGPQSIIQGTPPRFLGIDDDTFLTLEAKIDEVLEEMQ